MDVPGHAGKQAQQATSTAAEMTQAAAARPVDTGDGKFVARELVLGKPEEAAHGLKHALGLSREAFAQGYLLGEQAVVDEFEGPSADKDDRANLDYVLRVAALSEIPAHVQQQITNGQYHGGALASDDFDRGHGGMRLDDFMEHPHCQMAKLERVHVLVLRLYTSSSYPRFNTPLRQRVKPHPFAMSVYFLDEALRKLKAVGQNGAQAQQEVTLWRGMANVKVMDEFMRVGGTELAPMSTSLSKQTALSYARSDTPLVFRYDTRGLTRGCSIDFLSVYPGEQEFLYPPLTYLFCKERVVEDGVTIIAVEPQQA